MKKILLIVYAFMITCVNYAQVKEEEVYAKNSKGNAEYIKFKETRINSDEKSVKDFFKKQFDLKTDDDFKLEPKHNLTENRLESKKYQQFYKGIKVEYAIQSVVSENGNLKTLTGKHVAISNVNTIPKLTESQALSLVLANIGAKSYMWEDKKNEDFIKKDQNDEKATYYPKAELVIIEKDLFEENPTPVLAYKFSILASYPYDSLEVYIDAQSGGIIYKYSQIEKIIGTAATKYSGNRSIETQQVSTSQYKLRDYLRGLGIETFNMNNTGNYAGATDFLDNDNNWTSAEFDNANKDNAALDAHWGTEKVYDYFFQKHNRNSIDNQGFKLKSYVHANLPQINPDKFSSNDNAFWDGQRMTYGDGTYTFLPLTSIDVVGHEIAHGLCAKTAGLIPEGESGAINEGLSDIWGAMIEYYADPNKQTYLIGEEIKIGGGALRSMDNPNTFGNPDTYNGNYWYSNGNAHTNSGVFGHWFYILAEGKTETNDIGNFYNVAGMGKEKAAKIVYRAETVYFNATTNYFQARNYTIQAAEDLYGSNSIESITVAKAWYAVGVGSNATINYSLNGSYILCNENTATYSLTAPLPPAGSVPVWSISSNLTLISSNNSSITVKSSNIDGSGFITATFPDGSIANKEVWVGKFNSGSLTGTSAVCRSVSYYYYANVPGGHQAGYMYRWTMPNTNWQIFSQQDNSIYAGPSGPAGTNTAGQMLVEVNNGCGWSVIGGIIVYPNYSCTIGYSYIIYPNPTNSSSPLTVEKINTNAESNLVETILDTNATTETEIFEVEIKDLTGNTRIPKKTIKNKSQLDISILQKGVYLLLINNKGEVFEQKIIIN